MKIVTLTIDSIVAFEADEIIGFCSIDGYLLGKTAKYANLTMLFVGDRWKGKGFYT